MYSFLHLWPYCIIIPELMKVTKDHKTINTNNQYVITAILQSIVIAYNKINFISLWLGVLK